MSKEKSKTQKAVEHIFSHPGTRSDALAAIFGCEPKNVPAFMKGPIEAGLVISCKIERPGKPNVCEYKPSAAAPDKCPGDWLEWKRANFTAPVNPLKFKATGPRDGLNNSGSPRETQAVSGDVTTAAAAVSSPLGEKHLPHGEADDKAQAGSHGPEEATATASDPAASATPLTVAEWAEQAIARGVKTVTEFKSNHRAAQKTPSLHISLDNTGQLTIDDLKYSPEETRAIGEFLMATEPAWA